MKNLTEPSEKKHKKYKNLLTIALSHAFLGILCSNILLVYCKVGPSVDVLRWSKQEYVRYSLDFVNEKMISQEKSTIVIYKEQKTITVIGWIVGVDRELEEIFVSVGNKSYPVVYGRQRKDVAQFYKNPDYLNCGFLVQIPREEFPVGFYPLYLKVLLANRSYYNYPGKRIWIEIR